MQELKLSKAININGEKTNSIQYDLDNLTGESIENAVKEMAKIGYVSTVQEVDSILHAHIFAEASGLDYQDMKRLGAKDYIKATGIIRNFFLEDVEDSHQDNI
ncbi:hypothetical protein CLPU_6c00420 [Gottschalkia purinilytica]|uniref:Uncharacterized protein n=1 Tax=Gottschalkia purinilytica TaxID=1503 RepID=A0A0L0WAN6_GOTPU|nr:hypothetical protein [Gottschalkia purinilytica]KNF08556.1 hypothetical protein CLPU_6c00420 [Gottschalkia purinilytica]